MADLRQLSAEQSSVSKTLALRRLLKTRHASSLCALDSGICDASIESSALIAYSFREQI